MRNVTFRARYAAMLAYFTARPGCKFTHLEGIFVEPTSRGVILVATDGYALAVIHDADGHADAPTILGLPHPARRACASKRAGLIHFRGNGVYVTNDVWEDGTCPSPTRVGPNHLANMIAPPIEETYPEWRFAIPLDLSPTCQRASIGVRELKMFYGAAVAAGGNGGALTITPAGNGTRSLIVRINGVPEFFGLSVPALDQMTNGPEIPAFVGWPDATGIAAE